MLQASIEETQVALHTSLVNEGKPLDGRVCLKRLDDELTVVIT